MKTEGLFQLQSWMGVSESSVPAHTAGIVPSIYFSKTCGRVLFFDFAGDAEYYSSHAAILEGLASSKSGNNFIVFVVDLNQTEASIMESLHYWFSFVQNQVH